MGAELPEVTIMVDAIAEYVVVSVGPYSARFEFSDWAQARYAAQMALWVAEHYGRAIDATIIQGEGDDDGPHADQR